MKRAWNFEDLIGKVFGRLLVLRLGYIKNEKTYWLCKCECGKEVNVYKSSLKLGFTKSCGCLAKEVFSQNGKLSIIHGLEGTKIYRAWHSMKQRCLNINCPEYSRYGGRGIKVCEEWLDFINFKEDMYESYLKHIEEFGKSDTTLDRIDVNGNYEPSNCKWSTKKEQSRNRRISAKTENYNEYLYWRHRITRAITQILRMGTKKSKALKNYVGLDVNEFRLYIESKLLNGMFWSNRGVGPRHWQIDHIIGCNNFDLSKEEDRKKCFHYTNLQPLWHEDHLEKTFATNKD